MPGNLKVLSWKFKWTQGGNNNKSLALQLRRVKTDWSGCCQMAVQEILCLAKRLSLNLNFSFLNRISLLLIQVATQLSSRGWVNSVPDPILPEKFLAYSQESNTGPLGWQSDVLTTIPNRWSNTHIVLYNEVFILFQLIYRLFGKWTKSKRLSIRYWDRIPYSIFGQKWKFLSRHTDVLPVAPFSYYNILYWI